MSGCIVLATRNEGKVREIRQALESLPVRAVSLADLAPIDERIEQGETFADNARDKALYYAHATGRWCLADDSGLQVDALRGAPGVRSARYARDSIPPGIDRQTADEANNAKLLGALKDVPDEKRTARFVCHLVLARPGEILLEASGTVEGRIGREKRGTSGFGYDPLFFLPQLDCTMAELSARQKNRISHRGKAVRRLAGKLKDLLDEK